VGAAATAAAATPQTTAAGAPAPAGGGVGAGLTPLPGSVAAGVGASSSNTSLASAITAARSAVGVVNADDSSAPGAVGNEYRHARGDADAPTSSGGGSVDAAAGLSQSTPVDVGAAPTFRLSASVTGSDFSQELADRVSFMASNDLNGAKLQVTPPQLGPIELRISVTGDHAQVWMSTHSAVTRDALESSAPKLREMLGAQGFGQVSVDISQRSFQDRSAYAQPYEAPVSEGSAASALPVAGTSRVSAGMLDAYA
jgi:flagellar hook-length control protein FliK